MVKKHIRIEDNFIDCTDYTISEKEFYYEKGDNTLEYYEQFAEQIDEEVKELKDINSNENIDIFEEILMENLGFSIINSSFKDVKGGSVQTKHNIKNKIYANENMKYDRDTYVDKKEMEKYKKSKTNEDGTFVSEMTGKTIEGVAHTDHIVSAKEYHEEIGFAQSEKERKESVNCEGNFSIIEGSVNQSKLDQSLEEWKDNTQGGRDIKNEEHFNYDKETAKETEEKDEKMRKKIAKEQKKVLGKYYFKESIKKGVSKGANMALKIAITESIATTTKETISYSKINVDTNTSFKDFLFVVIDGFKLGVKKLFKEIVHILKKMLMTLANGLLETIIITVINIFFTTVTSIIKLIRSIINIITDIKLKLSNLKDKSKTEKKKIFLSLFMNGILTLPILSGIGVIETIENFFLSLGIPEVLSDVLAVGLSNFIGGLLLIIVSRYINEFHKAYNQKIANNIDLLNNRLKTNISSIKSISVQIELEKSLQVGLKLLESIKKEEIFFVNSIKTNLNSFEKSFNSLSDIAICDSLNLTIERISVKNNLNETKKVLSKLKDIEF